MTQEDINEVVTKSMPQWKKDQFDAIHANADYIEGLRRRIERLEEKLISHNKDYAELEKQRDDLLQFVEWVLAETVRQRNGEGGDLRTIQHTAESLLTRIKEGEK